MDGAPETENPKPSTDIKKMLRRLARQKQLYRGCAHTRGRPGSGSETEEKAELVAHATKEGQQALCDGGSFIQVFEYSLCSPRGGSLDPEDIAELDLND